MKSILLVEDDAFVVEFISSVLENNGYKLRVAKNEFAALDIINNYRSEIDLVLSDIKMTFQSSGFDLLKNIKINNTEGKIPFAFITGKSNLSSIEEAIKLGADDYIVKPIDPDVLLAKVAMLLNRYSGFPFAQRKVIRAATIHAPVTILTISEVGICALLPLELVINSKVRLDGDIFAEIGIDSPVIKIHSLKPDQINPQLYIVEGVFIGHTDRTAQKIRQWIVTQPEKSYANLQPLKFVANEK